MNSAVGIAEFTRPNCRDYYIKCNNCNTDIVRVDPQFIETNLVKGIYITYLHNEEHPRPGDLMQCPFCRYNYHKQLQDLWLTLKRKNLIGDWDE